MDRVKDRLRTRNPNRPAFRKGATLAGALGVIALAVAFALASPLLQWRMPVYIAAGLAGIGAMCLMLLQPLLIRGDLPRTQGHMGRKLHRWVGAALVLLILGHVVGLWITSPPDVVDALLFRAPAAFSAWGVVAMWTALAAALVAILRRRFRTRLRLWRQLHTGLVFVLVVTTILHAALIDGTMETVTKILLSVCILAALMRTILSLRAWTAGPR